MVAAALKRDELADQYRVGFEKGILTQ